MVAVKPIYTIEDLEVGTVVDGIGFSVVAKCVHGTKYYKYLGATVSSDVETVLVCDDDEHRITCCA